MTTSPRSGRVRFGPFKADLSSRELLRHGRVVRLHQQPFEILAMLLEHPGELVTREDLRQRLWPSNTFVNFDLGLNSAIKKLRDALRDSADDPRYVETLPRRGYRFIGTIEPESTGGPRAEAMANETVSPPEGTHVPRAYGRWLRDPATRWTVAAATTLVAALTLQGPVSRRHSTAASGMPAIHALAVLPLENLSGDPGQDFFADGMTDALITYLAQIGSVKVISRTSVMPYRGTHKPLPDIGGELHVDAIVEGAVIRAGDRVRIDAQLVEAATDRHLWSATYERSVSEVTSVQTDIARAVASEIRGMLTPAEEARLSHSPSVDPETYDLYLKGRYFWNKYTPDSDRKSIDYFQAALQRRPDYAPAYAGLAEAYVNRRDLPPREKYAKAKAAARAALRIDDAVSDAHTALAASLFYYDWDWTGAKQEFEHALTLNPNDAMAHQWYGQYQKALGWKNWAAEVKRAGELDPLSPIVAGGGWYIQIGQYDRAAELLAKKIELDPHLPFPHQLLGAVYRRQGKFDDAIRELRTAADLSGGAPPYLSSLGHAYGLAGRRAEADEMLRQLERLSRQEYVSPYLFAIVYASLGEKDLAFALLDKAVADRAPELVMLNVPWGELYPLRTDPRFAELKRRVGLPE